MSHDRADDVASPIDLRVRDDACAWAASAMSKRPGASSFFSKSSTSCARSTALPFALYMTVEEQRDCLAAAGFGAVTKLLEMRGLVLHRAMH